MRSGREGRQKSLMLRHKSQRDRQNRLSDFQDHADLKPTKIFWRADATTTDHVERGEMFGCEQDHRLLTIQRPLDHRHRSELGDVPLTIQKAGDPYRSGRLHSHDLQVDVGSAPIANRTVTN